MNSDEAKAIIAMAIGILSIRCGYLHQFIAGNGDDVSFLPLIFGMILFGGAWFVLGQENHR